MQIIAETHTLLMEAKFDLQAFMQATVDRAVEITGADAVIELVEGREMVYRAASPGFVQHLGARWNRAKSLSGLCVKTAQILVCDDALEDSRVDREACVTMGIRSMVCAPLLSGQGPAGVLKILSGRPHAFSADDVRDLGLIAGALAAALARQVEYHAKEASLLDRTQALAALQIEVEERQRLEAAAKADEQRIHSVVAYAQQAIVSTNQAGLVTRWNNHAEQMFGWSAEEAIGQSMSELIVPPEQRPMHGEAMDRFLETGKHVVFGQRIEVAALRRNGERFPIELAITAFSTPEGWEFTALMHDITDRKEKVELFENAFHHAAIGMALVALDGRFLRVNAAFCALLGYQEGQMLSLDFQTITHPADLSGDLEQLSRLTAGEIPSYEMDKRYLRADGSITWVRLCVSLVANQDGRPKHFIAQVQDLTPARNAEERYRLLAENASDMVGLHSLDGACLYMSPSCEQLLGYTPEEMAGKTTFDFIPVEEHEGLWQAHKQLSRSPPGTPVPHTMRMRRKDGVLVWVHVIGRVINRDDGTAVVAAASRDVTRQVEAQLALEQKSRDLEAAMVAAEAAAAAKSEFLANMSHEIRTPLTGILGFARLLAEVPNLDAVARAHVERMQFAGQALLSIVNDILDFSKLEAGHIEIAPRPVAAEDLVRGVLAMFGPQANAKGLTLDLQMDGEGPPWVALDPDRLRQILLNLIGNAIKFTDVGGVRLGLRYDAVRGRLHLEVKDTGPGLSAAQQRKLFKRFSQVDGSPTRRHGGTGLGLAICKGLVEAMGGEINVTSKVRQGSTFAFSLPAPVAAAPPNTVLTTSPTPSIEDVRVLVVDDNVTNRELVRVVLQAMGAEVSEAADGEAAVRAAASAPYDIVLMDIRMPGMDGPEALRRIRAAEGPNQAVPVMAFSANSDLEHLVGGEGGFDDIVRKPIDPAALVSMIVKWTHAEVMDAGRRPSSPMSFETAP